MEASISQLVSELHQGNSQKKDPNISKEMDEGKGKFKKILTDLKEGKISENLLKELEQLDINQLLSVLQTLDIAIGEFIESLDIDFEALTSEQIIECLTEDELGDLQDVISIRETIQAVVNQLQDNNQSQKLNQLSSEKLVQLNNALDQLHDMIAKHSDTKKEFSLLTDTFLQVGGQTDGEDVIKLSSDEREELVNLIQDKLQKLTSEPSQTRVVEHKNVKPLITALKQHDLNKNQSNKEQREKEGFQVDKGIKEMLAKVVTKQQDRSYSDRGAVANNSSDNSENFEGNLHKRFRMFINHNYNSNFNNAVFSNSILSENNELSGEQFIGKQRPPLFFNQTQPDQFIQQLKDVIQQAKFQRQGDNATFKMQLKPEHLGQLKMHLSMKGGNIEGQIITQTQQVRELIQGHLPDLRSQLEEQGLSFSELDVTVTEDDQNQEFDQGSNNNSSQVKLIPESDDYGVDKDEVGNNGLSVGTESSMDLLV